MSSASDGWIKMELLCNSALLHRLQEVTGSLFSISSNWQVFTHLQVLLKMFTFCAHHVSEIHVMTRPTGTNQADHDPQSESLQTHHTGASWKHRAFAPAHCIRPEPEKCQHKAESKLAHMHTDYFYGGCFFALLRDLTRTCPQRIIVR